MENSRGSLTYIDIIRMTSESPIWKINKKSRIKVGSGMIRRNTMRTTNAVTTLFVKLANLFNSAQILFILILISLGKH